jgi:hypothetical protein
MFPHWSRQDCTLSKQLRYQIFRVRLIIRRPDVEAVRASETSFCFETTRRYIQEDCHVIRGVLKLIR